jgi:hypothetical protein
MALPFVITQASQKSRQDSEVEVGHIQLTALVVPRPARDHAITISTSW